MSGTPQDRVTHPLNVSYLVVGLVFLGIAGTWAMRETGLVDDHDTGWLLPLILVVAGMVGLVAFMARGVSRRRQREDDVPEGPDDAPADDDLGADYSA